jgi:ribosomal protein S18 acetylase RimI-like enzyme
MVLTARNADVLFTRQSYASGLKSAVYAVNPTPPAKVHRLLHMSDQSHQIVVRRCRDDDVDELMDMLGASWRAAYTGIMSAQKINGMIGRIAAMKHDLIDPQFHHWLAVMDGKIVGMIWAEHAVIGRTLKIYMLYVHPDYQNRGIGTVLLDEVWERFSDMATVKLDVLQKNERGIAFYKRRGFSISYPSFHVTTFMPIYVMKKAIRTGITASAEARRSG